MDDQDRVSQTSSVATISYFPVMQECDGRVQAFGKRCQSARRDPNCSVDSSGLKLWKRRWFVLSNYCLYYYKDSREESLQNPVLHTTECKNRKFTFKVVHQGMRSYFFSADTQEDMLGWVRALSQSAAMESNSSLNRRCSSYQDFTHIGGSTESVDFPRTPSDGEDPSQRHRNVSRTLSEPSHLAGGRMGASRSEPRGRRSVRQRNSRTPSPPEFSRRRACDTHQEEDYLPGQITPPMQTEMIRTGSLSSRGQLGSRPHTPVGRVDIRPNDDSATGPNTLYYAPASPLLEFKSTPTTPVTERWQSISKPIPTYGSVLHISSGRRPLGKPPKPEPPPIRPLESDADVVLTRLCGCDKLLQSLSVELAQLQMDKDSVQCALEVSRLELEEWKSQGPRAQEEALTQKGLLQEELVTIRAKMCDVSLEMERVWSQYERMESELWVIRSHLQHICNFGVPQDQSQAQRELWMMEDILAGLKINRDHFRFLLGLQRHHLFQPSSPHPGSPGSPTERMQSGLQMDEEEEPPLRPPLPQELQESFQSRHQGHGWTESPYEAIYSHTCDPAQRGGHSQPDLLSVKSQRDSFESGSKWIPPDATNQSTKTREEAPFPIRVTRVVTAVLPSSLVARRVSVEDPPPELDNPLPEQIPPEMQETFLNKPSRRLVLEGPDQRRSSAEIHHDQARESRSEKTSRNQLRDQEGLGNGSESLDVRTDERGEGQEVPPDTARKQRMKSGQRSYDGYGSCDHIRGSAELQRSSGTCHAEDEREAHVKKSKGQLKLGNKTQDKDHSGRTGVAKSKIRRPASPYHISSMTVHQKDGGKGFTRCKDGEEKKFEDPDADDRDGDFSSSDLRANWFLSTNQWKGLPMPMEACNEEISDVENQTACTDDLTDSNAMSLSVSESLEKMKENHSLFYKIACDICISDTDITKTDGISQTSSRPEEELLITESLLDEVIHSIGRSFKQQSLQESRLHMPSDVDENSLSINDELQDSTEDNAVSNTSANLEKDDDTSRQNSQLEVKETVHGDPVQDTNSDQALDESAKTREEQSGTKESEDSKVDQERAEERKTCESIIEEDKDTVPEGGNNRSITPSGSVYEGQRLIRSASFGKARVTVLRTSL
ncbi:hypothetical protein KUCAC02_027464 [Chaenocephalus aceratus]|uniref:Uncharacterized protein n=1 Tax=Chaenocephalus aceratus TaxID=36190 RepID=A0ACB9W589_CHAAC|nr:hypothetical protein KUCAC02_027464 [Chaenocephalus aceratus]